MLVTVPINKDASPGKSAQEPGGTPTRESVVWQKVAPPSDLLFLDPKACVEGLAKIITSWLAHCIHCFGHKLNLAVEGVMSAVPALLSSLEMIHQIRNLVTGSSKRQTILENALTSYCF
jgi:hypothetical protein